MGCDKTPELPNLDETTAGKDPCDSIENQRDRFFRVLCDEHRKVHRETIDQL